ncbi:MAG: response regulator transcription factor [Roseateles sp.]|uniref:Two-component system OmpR family response regulator n=1 Tax=Roseateles asaccharophilus TaxID=582607 RepID=A0ABU2AG81_9BURK|nr:response regulator transcription factor [Roseateles asaccharophilus]MDR7336212.1 two-component system OmpR family response regulator [Roseateles asaccharophilus]
MASAGRLLVIDDHPEIRDALEAFLTRRGFAVRAASDLATARNALQDDDFDLIVLDVMLPDGSGLALCRELQAGGRPVILLSALAAPAHRVAGLETGADDYLIKPFEPDELNARIRNVLRRCGRATQATAAWVYRFAEWCFDPSDRSLSHDDGRRLALSAAESRLLAVLLQRPGEVLARQRLLDLCSEGAEVFDRSIDSQVSRLRRKIEADPRRPALLRTAWGDGYQLTATVSKQALAEVPLAV